MTRPKRRQAAPEPHPAPEVLWAAFEASWELAPHERLLMDAARQAFDRWVEIRARIDAEGVLLPGRYEGVERVHPLLVAEDRARRGFIAAVRAIGLEEAHPKDRRGRYR